MINAIRLIYQSIIYKYYKSKLKRLHGTYMSCNMKMNTAKAMINNIMKGYDL
jgi:hypothetical protein